MQVVSLRKPKMEGKRGEIRANGYGFLGLTEKAQRMREVQALQRILPEVERDTDPVHLRTSRPFAETTSLTPES